jgi:hypothetical protein
MASRLLTDCVDELQQKVPLIIAEYNSLYSGRSLRPISTLRSTEEQQAIYAIGRTVAPIGDRYIRTKNDGVLNPSKHNPWPDYPLSKAVDFGVFVMGHYYTDNTFYYPLLDLARKYDLISGGDFIMSGSSVSVLLAEKKWRDWSHIETKTPLYVRK